MPKTLLLLKNTSPVSQFMEVLPYLELMQEKGLGFMMTKTKLIKLCASSVIESLLVIRALLAAQSVSYQHILPIGRQLSSQNTRNLALQRLSKVTFLMEHLSK